MICITEGLYALLRLNLPVQRGNVPIPKIVIVIAFAAYSRDRPQVAGEETSTR